MWPMDHQLDNRDLKREVRNKLAKGKKKKDVKSEVVTDQVRRTGLTDIQAQLCKRPFPRSEIVSPVEPRPGKL